jgi:hypothetical protein
MSDQKAGGPALSRRDALKALAAAGGAAALSTVPNTWEKPMVQVGVLPALAQASPLTFPFRNEVDVRIEQNGVELAGASWFEDQGWVGVYVPDPNNSAPRLLSDHGHGNQPWRKLKRRPVGVPAWAFGSVTVILTLSFFVIDVGKPKKRPKGKCFCYCYGLFGSVYNGLLEGEIVDGKVVFLITLPVNFFGFFFFSCYFPLIIVLEDDDELDSAYYFGPCLYGPKSPYGQDDTDDDLPDEVDDEDSVDLGGYIIAFKGVVYGTGGTGNLPNVSTWTYEVREFSQPADLKEWVLSLPLDPDCAVINTSNPTGTEVSPDPESQLTGIQWSVDPAFTQGEFSVTIVGEVAVGLVDVAITNASNQTLIGHIAGPICI